jgi:hypothetical protein
MAGMTIEQMRNQVRSIIDIDNTDISDDVLNRILGQGFDQIVYSERRWPFYEINLEPPFVNGTKDYSLDSLRGTTTSITDHAGETVTLSLRDILSIRTDDHIVTFIGTDAADYDYPKNQDASGAPWEWLFFNETVRFFPTPNSTDAFYVRAIRNATDFGASTASGTKPDIPDAFHSIITTYGIWKTYLQQEDPVMAQQYMTQFHMELDNVARRYADMPAPQPLLLNNRRSSRWASGLGPLRYSTSGGVIW